MFEMLCIREQHTITILLCSHCSHTHTHTNANIVQKYYMHARTCHVLPLPLRTRRRRCRRAVAAELEHTAAALRLLLCEHNTTIDTLVRSTLLACLLALWLPACLPGWHLARLPSSSSLSLLGAGDWRSFLPAGLWIGCFLWHGNIRVPITRAVHRELSSSGRTSESDILERFYAC